MSTRALVLLATLSGGLFACSSEAIERSTRLTPDTGGGTGSGTGGTAAGGTGGSTSGTGGAAGGSTAIPDYTQSPCYGQPAQTLVYSLTTHDTHTVNATCRAEGQYARVYVADELWQTQFDASLPPLDQSEVDAFMAGYELKGAAGSYRPDLGVLPTDEAVFGELVPAALTDGKLPIFVIDSSGAGDGYLCSWCDSTQLHLDYPLLGSLHTDKTLSIAAHESFHAIHRGYDANESSWVDESLAEAAMTVNGYFTDQAWLASFLHDTNVTWGPTLSDAHDFNYGAGLLLGSYLWERGGAPLMFAITHEPANDWTGIDNALASVEDPENSWQIWGELGLALYLDDPATGYEFKSFDLAGQTLPYMVPTGQVLDETVAPYGLVFVTFDTDASSVTLTTTGSIAARLVFDGSPVDVQDLAPNEPFTLDSPPRVLMLTAKTATDFELQVD